MEVVRYGIAAGFFGLAAASFFSFTVPPAGITISGATLSPMGAGLALSATIDNQGGPDRLVGIGSDTAARAILIGGEGFVLPAGSSPSLAMDGAHGMLMGIQGEIASGRLVPVTLWFDEAGRVTTRARIDLDQAMAHGVAHPVPEGAPAPSVSLSVEASGDGWQVTLNTENFAFSQEAADGLHEPGFGHGHLYLNGLKLQRVYAPRVVLGALPTGTHQVRVTLNTNDHKVYSVSETPVAATARIVAE